MNTNGQSGQNLDSIRFRLAARGPEGELLSLITGQESLEELRQLIIECSHVCPAKQIHLECPFHIMGTLSYDSLNSLVNTLPREACEALFRMELECRAQVAAPCAPKGRELM